jgi:hypothetical protein
MFIYLVIVLLNLLLLLALISVNHSQNVSLTVVINLSAIFVFYLPSEIGSETIMRFMLVQNYHKIVSIKYYSRFERKSYFLLS